MKAVKSKANASDFLGNMKGQFGKVQPPQGKSIVYPNGHTSM